jgi:hypothetical protein
MLLEMINEYKILLGKIEGTRLLERLGVHNKIILNGS